MKLEFAAGRFVIAVFVSGAIGITMVVVLIYQISSGTSTILLSNYPMYINLLALPFCGFGYALLGKYKPSYTEVTSVCIAIAILIMLEVMVISGILIRMLY